MTKYDVPRDDEGRRLCEHCQKTPVPESLGTKPRRYCSRNCRQRAYEARKTGKAIRTSVDIAVRRERTSRDKEEQKTRDVPGVTSDDAKKNTQLPVGIPGLFPGLGLVGPAPRRGRRGSTATASPMPLPPEDDEE